MRAGQIIGVGAAALVLAGAGGPGEPAVADNEGLSEGLLGPGGGGDPDAATRALAATLDTVAVESAPEYRAMLRDDGGPSDPALWRELYPERVALSLLSTRYGVPTLDHEVLPPVASTGAAWDAWWGRRLALELLLISHAAEAWHRGADGEVGTGAAVLADAAQWTASFALGNSAHSYGEQAVSWETQLLEELGEYVTAWPEPATLDAAEALLLRLEDQGDGRLGVLDTRCAEADRYARALAADPLGGTDWIRAEHRRMGRVTTAERFKGWLLFDLEETEDLIDEVCAETGEVLARAPYLHPSEAAIYAPWSPWASIDAADNQTGIEVLQRFKLSTDQFKRWAELDAARASLRVIVAVERYRQAEGEDPDGLDALVPEYLSAPAVDPFTGEWPDHPVADGVVGHPRGE